MYPKLWIWVTPVKNDLNNINLSLVSPLFVPARVGFYDVKIYKGLKLGLCIVPM